MMELPINSNASKQAVSAFKETARQAPLSKAVSASAQQKKALNASILQAHHEVSLKSKDEPLALVYKTAIDAINEELKAEFGDNAIQTAYEEGLDVSPEATADRIVTLSTNFFAAFQEQHPELTEAEQAERFVSVIGGGIDQGFKEARDILDGLKVLEGEIADNIDATYDLVQEGLKSFLARYDIAESES